MFDKAEENFREVLLLEPNNPNLINYFAYFLIDKNRNIIEGLELADKALQLSPDNSSIIDTKGWGLFKQGKYKEALELLEKSWELKSCLQSRNISTSRGSKKGCCQSKDD